MLKTDLHMHVKGDPEDNIKHTAEELIEYAARLKFDVLSITCHNTVIFNDHLHTYAASKGILLIPGAEKTLNGKHILLYNITNEELHSINSFDDIRQLKKKKEMLVIAPHPYFKFRNCVGKELEQNIDVFDAIEHSHFHTYGFNCNKKAIKIGKKHNKPIIALSDTHDFIQFNTSYSLINAEKNSSAVITAIKRGELRWVSPPLPIVTFVKIVGWMARSIVNRLMNKNV